MLRVLTHPRNDGPSLTPTVHLFEQALTASVEVIGFSWRHALIGRYDLLHIHWPELLLRHKNSHLRTALKQILFAALLVRLFATRRPSVWTVHNERPHEGSRLVERGLLRAWFLVSSAHVYMYESAVPASDQRRAVYIPRGDYQPLYSSLIEEERETESVPGRLLLFGMLRPYKGTEQLLAAFTSMRRPNSFSLVVRGRPLNEEYRKALVDEAAQVDGVTLVPEGMSDRELAHEISLAEVVVLPYRKMYNSGVALLALEFARPLIVPRSATMEELSREVGRGWITMYEAPLTAAKLADSLALVNAASRPGPRPDLSARSWEVVADRYLHLYTRLAVR